MVLYFYRMQIISTNLGKPTTIIWNGREEITGIFKYPVDRPIRLESQAVLDDTVANKKVHGGIYKSCYLFSTDQYPYWKKKYPQLHWDWGMFGENLSVGGLDESTLYIGSIYRIGKALVRITQPREPCYKLGVRFKDQQILRQFIEHPYPGAYVSVIEEGEVKKGDSMELVEIAANPLSIQEFYQLLFATEKNKDHLKMAMENSALPVKKRDKLKKWI